MLWQNKKTRLSVLLSHIVLLHILKVRRRRPCSLFEMFMNCLSIDCNLVRASYVGDTNNNRDSIGIGICNRGKK